VLRSVSVLCLLWLSSAGLAAPRVAVVLTRPGEISSDVVLTPLDSSATPTSLGSFPHLAGAAIRAAVLPGTSQVVAVADVAPTGDFSSGLFHVRSGPSQRPLLQGLFHASRPLPVSATRVLVERGVEGPALTDRLRVDSLGVDLLEVDTGVVRRVHSYSGYTTHLIAVFRGEVLVYRVGPGGADLVAVHLSSLGVRVLARLVPMARDFQLDEAGGRVVFTNAIPEDHAWGVFSVDVQSGQSSVWARGKTPALSPWVMTKPSGERLLLWNTPAEGVRSGLGRPTGFPAAMVGSGQRLLGSTPGEGYRLFMPQGYGTQVAPWVWETSSSRAMKLFVPSGMRADVAGFVSSEAGR
jgi:hypothetical protein